MQGNDLISSFKLKFVLLLYLIIYLLLRKNLFISGISGVYIIILLSIIFNDYFREKMSKLKFIDNN